MEDKKDRSKNYLFSKKFKKSISIDVKKSTKEVRQSSESTDSYSPSYGWMYRGLKKDIIDVRSYLGINFNSNFVIPTSAIKFPASMNLVVYNNRSSTLFYTVSVMPQTLISKKILDFDIDDALNSTIDKSFIDIFDNAENTVQFKGEIISLGSSKNYVFVLTKERGRKKDDFTLKLNKLNVDQQKGIIREDSYAYSIIDLAIPNLQSNIRICAVELEDLSIHVYLYIKNTDQLYHILFNGEFRTTPKHVNLKTFLPDNTQISSLQFHESRKSKEGKKVNIFYLSDKKNKKIFKVFFEGEYKKSSNIIYKPVKSPKKIISPEVVCPLQIKISKEEMLSENNSVDNFMLLVVTGKDKQIYTISGQDHIKVLPLIGGGNIKPESRHEKQTNLLNYDIGVINTIINIKDLAVLFGNSRLDNWYFLFPPKILLALAQRGYINSAVCGLSISETGPHITRSVIPGVNDDLFAS